MAAAAAAEGRFLHSMCRKTKMCKYYAHGRCNRRDTCDFAHSLDELRRAPDLSRTKVCPMLSSTGKCDDEHCAFAHCKADLRKLRLPPGTRPGKAAAAPGAGIAMPVPPAGAQAKVRRGEQGLGVAEHSIIRLPESGLDASQAGSMQDQASVPAKTQPRKGNSSQKPLPGWDWGAKFHKTTLCAFHLNGKCNKGQACHFAHGAEELRPLPDLSCTKLCLQLLNTGVCNDANCRYAHTREELRMLPAWAMEESNRLPTEDLPVVNEVEEHTSNARAAVEEPCLSPVPEASEDMGVRLLVKNTFLDIEEEATSMPLRSKTQPTLPSMLEDNWPGSVPSTTPSTPRSVSSEEAVSSQEEATGSEEPVHQMLRPVPPHLTFSPRSATSSESGSRVASWPASSTEELLENQSLSSEVNTVHVKNTFLTVDELDDDLCLPVKAKSMPELPLFADTEGTCAYEGSLADESSSTVTPSLPHRPSSPSCSSSESDDGFEFTDIALDVSCELPALPEMSFGEDHTTMVPVCALQLVEKVPEEPEALIFNDMVTFPALRKKMLKPGAMSAQNKSLYWEQGLQEVA